MNELDVRITKKQRAFIEAKPFEVLYGGAAGGGKSYGQVIDALLYAVKYPGSKQLILRRTFAELDKSIIRTVLGLYPRELFSYNSSMHTGKFRNGSILDFGYCANENDVYQYQSAEYDVIRFDELTHFTEEQYKYLVTRIRGANKFPRHIKSSTNPGGVGHTWVKKRFIDPAPPGTAFKGEDGLERIFIPAKLKENTALMKNDPSYEKNLLAQPEHIRRALLDGDWNITEGQYFTEFKTELHVCRPFEIPSEWRRYRAIDYGLDGLACLWVAVSSTGECYVYRELLEKNVAISPAAAMINEYTNEDEEIYVTLAPPDLWGRSQESGKTKALLFSEAGLTLVKSSNDREAGWLCVKELLLKSEGGYVRLHIFDNCRNLIEHLPSLIIDPKRPTDCLTEPHEITHIPDALRYFAIYWIRPNAIPDTTPRRKWTRDMWEDYNRATKEQREYLIQKYGRPE